MDPRKENNNPQSQGLNSEPQQTPSSPAKKPEKRHLIKCTWLRRVLKTLLWIIIAILLIPVLLYIPPVQTFVKNIACSVVKKSTGMEMTIDRLRIKFPLKAELSGVLILDQKGDTMVCAGEALADVKPLPLLALDVKVNRLRLVDGYYRMLSTDSSMNMKLRAGLLEVDEKSSVSISKSNILLNKALLRDGDVQLYMDVWKKKPTPEDTVSGTPFLIKANDLRLENFTFGMSMLPTIDTLALHSDAVELKKGVIDLHKNLITWQLATMKGGSAKYLTPDAEYIKTHPAPESEPSSDPPMIIKGDSLWLENFTALYGVKGTKPAAGFDPSYISVSDVAIGMKNFYNESSVVRLPITRLEALERSGLRILEGNGTVAVDSTGLSLDSLTLLTPYSHIKATAVLPFAMMELKPSSPMSLKAKAFLGMPDIEAFMPSVKEYTSKIPARNPLALDVEASGTSERLEIPKLDVALCDILSLEAAGYAENPLDIKKLRAHVDFDGDIADPRLIDSFTGNAKIKAPAFRIKGEAGADRETYTADFRLLSDAGNVEADGKVSLNSEAYHIDADLANVNVGRFMPETGIGTVSGNLRMSGAGFNPLSGKATTNAELLISSIEYRKLLLKDIRARLNLDRDGTLDLYAISPNQYLDLDLEGTGKILPDNYTFDISARLRNLDLRALGMTSEANNGKGTIYLAGTASPGKWLYDVDLKLADFDWNLSNSYIHIPDGMTAHLGSTETSTSATVSSSLTSIDFQGRAGLKQLADAFTEMSKELNRQIAEKVYHIDRLSATLPDFSLDMNASGKGLINQFLVPQGLSVDTVFGHFERDSLLHGKIGVRNFATQSLRVDTISLNLNQQNAFLDYLIHVGNRKGNLDEFAQVDLSGKVGENRLEADLRQLNFRGQTGYRLGFAAALQDSLVTLSFKPLDPVIAYMPWSLNENNYISYNFNNRRIMADLVSQSSESKILLRTEPYADGKDELHLNLQNIRIQDFISLLPEAPAVEGSVDSEMRVRYSGKALVGKGTLDVKNLSYDSYPLGDFGLTLLAGARLDGKTAMRATMKVDGKDALSALVRLSPDSTGIQPDSIGVTLTRFPMKIANPFLGGMAKLGGSLNGKLSMEGTFEKPSLDGALAFDSVTVNVPMAGCTLKFDEDPVTVTGNIIRFDKFEIRGVNNNPLTLDGTVDARSFADIRTDLRINGNDCQLIGNDSRAKSDLYGKLFIDLDGTVRGSLSRLDIRANLDILGKTDLTYNLGMTPSELSGRTENDVVKFVNFNDTTSVVDADSITPTSTMRIRAGLSIAPGTKVTVLLSTNGTDRLEIQPTASLNYFQNYMGDMRLNGTVTTGNGFVRYSVPVMGQKMFTFNPESKITWNGDLMNPTLDVRATDEMKANVTQDGNSRLVNFLVTLTATNTLSNPKVVFDLSTNDDISIQNELQSMSVDQRQTQAMNLLLYGQYTGQNTKANANLGGNMLYSFLESQLNSWAAKNIRGVNLSFGIDQYDRMQNGTSSTETSYSYQVSKSLFNNRFKIQVGGNYSTDSSVDENLSQNLISDVSFEYMLRQTQTLNMSVKIFRHIGYESILEGEVTETGVGFVLKKKLHNLLNLFRITGLRKRRGAKKETKEAEATETQTEKKKENETETEK